MQGGLIHGIRQSRGASPSARQRDAHNASSRLTSFSVESEEAGCFHEVAGVSIIDVGVRVRCRHLHGREPSGLNNISTVG